MNICEHILSAGASLSPFGKMLVTGFYDGATDGFVECQHCGRAYAFRKLAWDEEQDVRIYGLAPLDVSLENIRLDTLHLPPGDDPVSLVPPLGEQEREAVERLAAAPVQHVVAAANLRRGVLASKSLVVSDEDTHDWFAWLGLERDRG